LLRALRLLLGLQHPTRRELMDTRDAVDGLEQRVDAHYRELKELRGRINAINRWEKARQDDPGEEIEPTPELSHPPVSSTAHLARRFRTV
jgi:hypothetical protein